MAQTVDPIGRLNQIQSGGVNFLTINTADYNAASEPTKLTLGNNVVGTMGYNTRLQLTSLVYTSGASTPSTLLNLGYNYTSTTVPGNNGQIQSITDGVDSGRSESFTYDAWGRLATAQTQGSTAFSAWGLSWTYDRFGNRLAQTPTLGSAPLNNVSVNPATNQLMAPYAYDLAGNMTKDGSNNMAYDGENRVASSTPQAGGAQTNYTYDGNGLRIQKATGSASTVYIFFGAKVVAEYDNAAAVASPSREYIYAGGRLLSTIDSTGTKYHLSGHLSPHITTDANGAVIGTQAHYPFGEKWYETGTTTKYKFTSYERDSETGNDYAIARYNVNRLGRFTSVDRLAGSTSDPQSLNRYAYVLNDPVNSADPSGAKRCPLNDNGDSPCGGDGGGGGGFTLDGQPVSNGVGQAALAGGFACVGSCDTSFQGPAGKTFTIVQTAGSTVYLGPNGGELSDESVAEIGLPPADLNTFNGGTPGSGRGGSGQSPCSRTPSNNSRQVLLVARDIGGPNGTLSGQGHAGLVFNVGTNDQPDHFIVQGGPTTSGGLQGSVTQATGGWWQTFSMAQGANWSNPSATVQVPVSVLSTFYLSASQSTQGNLDSLTGSLNSSLSGATYNYANGPNSNTYINAFIGRLCGPGFLSVPNQIPLK